MAKRICFVGLGNPGPRYDGTRHNIGFDWIDEVVKQNLSGGLKEFSKKFQSLWCMTTVRGQEVHFLKPQTFMNLSGEALAEWKSKYQGETRYIVVFDDMDLELGRLRLRYDGSDGGHRGLRSVIEHLGTKEVPRLRIGIGRPAGEVIDYVLEKFKPEEKKTLESIMNKANDFLHLLIEDDLTKAMNEINGARF